MMVSRCCRRCRGAAWWWCHIRQFSPTLSIAIAKIYAVSLTFAIRRRLAAFFIRSATRQRLHELRFVCHEAPLASIFAAVFTMILLRHWWYYAYYDIITFSFHYYVSYFRINIIYISTPSLWCCDAARHITVDIITILLLVLAIYWWFTLYSIFIITFPHSAIRYFLTLALLILFTLLFIRCH